MSLARDGCILSVKLPLITPSYLLQIVALRLEYSVDQVSLAVLRALYKVDKHEANLDATADFAASTAFKCLHDAACVQL